MNCLPRDSSYFLCVFQPLSDWLLDKCILFNRIFLNKPIMNTCSIRPHLPVMAVVIMGLAGSFDEVEHHNLLITISQFLGGFTTELFSPLVELSMQLHILI